MISLEITWKNQGKMKTVLDQNWLPQPSPLLLLYAGLKFYKHKYVAEHCQAGMTLTLQVS